MPYDTAQYDATRRTTAREAAGRHADPHAEQARMSIDYYSHHPELIGQRLEELAKEPSVEKVFQYAMAGASLGGFVFSLTRSRLWRLLPVAAAAVSLKQGITGESRVYDLIHKLGFRRAEEIEAERFALKSLRGDVGEYESTGQTMVEMPENVGRTSDAMPMKSENYVE